MKRYDEAYKAVMEKYRGRCVVCGNKAVCVHEIVPLSISGRMGLEESNRVSLCANCHDAYGTTKWAYFLKQKAAVWEQI